MPEDGGFVRGVGDVRGRGDSGELAGEGEEGGTRCRYEVRGGSGGRFLS